MSLTYNSKALGYALAILVPKIKVLPSFQTTPAS
jgi:hypothetical protein